MAVSSERALKKVAVTGASGRTGSLVVKKLLERPSDFEVMAVVRSKDSAKALFQAGLPETAVWELDFTKADAPAISEAFSGCQALVIVTSAVPQLAWYSVPGAIWGRLRGQPAMPTFTWKAGQVPELVDWLGQKAQIDAAKEAGLRHVVLIGSMGGTQPDHFLNKIGNGNILLWKRKAEQYLIASGLHYTIIHPGGLKDEPGGKREVVLGVDDELMKSKVRPDSSARRAAPVTDSMVERDRTIPREDVAELAVQSLMLPSALNRSFDAGSRPPGNGTKTSKNFAALLEELGLRNCDYSLNLQA